MQQKVLLITRDQIGALRERLPDPAQLESCIREIKRMHRIKAHLLIESTVGC